jgi:serine-type D-Ala-D-Ala carboxypeptidase (penicillin-binding protein 5/6)
MMCFVLFVSQTSYLPNHVSAAETVDLNLQAEAAVIVDGKTGKILYEKNADTVLGVASMSKMMTEYIVLEAISENKISWDQPVKINEYVHNLSKAPGLSNVGLTQGENYTVKELYGAMAVHSGNAATVALAELISGSETNFVALMNEKAGELGLKKYKFVNSSGLSNSDLLGKHPAGNEDEENVMTAKDTATLAYRLVNDFPDVLEYAKISKLKFRDGKEYANFNWMLPGLIYEYEGVDGLKTGSTDFAGYGHTATAIRDGQRFITVVMKSTSKTERFEDSVKLMDYAFANFSKTELVPANEQIEDPISVAKGKEDTVKIQTADSIELVIKNGNKENYETEFVIDKSKLNENGELIAPIKKGEVIGSLTVKQKEGTDYGFLNEEGAKAAQVDVVAAETVEKANWFVLSMQAVGGFFGDVWHSASSTVKGWF